MADSQTPRNANPNERPPEETPGTRKHRRRGYRGYPNTPKAGDVHTGSGFGGAGSVDRSGYPADSSIISERTREDAGKD